MYSSNTSSLSGIIYWAINLLQGGVVPLLLALGLVYFLWGVVRYVTAGESEDKMKEGRSLMIYGIIALFVMISVFGLVRILLNTFSQGGASGFQFAIPTLPTGGN